MFPNRGSAMASPADDLIENDPARLRAGLVRLTLLAVLGGAATGLVATAFRIVLTEGAAAAAALRAAADGQGIGLAGAVALSAALIGAAAWAVARLSPETAGSGIPHVEAVMEGRARPGGLRLLAVKFAGGAAAMTGGLALGREGPSVQMGASLAHMIAAPLRLPWADQRILIAACAGAGLAAAFNAPIAGAIFVLEELVRRFETRIAIAALTASAAAIAVSRTILGQGLELPVDIGVQGAALAHPAFALFGLVAGAVAVVYNRALILAMDGMDRLPLSPGWRGMLVGAGVGALTYHAAGLVGPGEDLTRRALDAVEPLAILPALLLFRLAFSVLSYAVGAPGGIFAPLLVLGAELGLMCGLLADALLPAAGLDPRAFAVAGMAALFTGGVRAPLTGIVIVTEMTGSTHVLLPIMSACAAAMLVPTLAGSRPIYAVLRDRSAASAAVVPGEAAPAPVRDA